MRSLHVVMCSPREWLESTGMRHLVSVSVGGLIKYSLICYKTKISCIECTMIKSGAPKPSLHRFICTKFLDDAKAIEVLTKRFNSKLCESYIGTYKLLFPKNSHMNGAETLLGNFSETRCSILSNIALALLYA